MLGIPAVTTLHVMDPRETGRDRARARLTAVARRTCHRARDRRLRVHPRVVPGHRRDRPEHVVTVHNGISARPAPGAGAEVRERARTRRRGAVGRGRRCPAAGEGTRPRSRRGRAGSRRAARLRLLIAGDGPARDDVKRLAARLGGAAVLAGHRDDVMAVSGCSRRVCCIPLGQMPSRPCCSRRSPPGCRSSPAASAESLRSWRTGTPGCSCLRRLTASAFAHRLKRLFGDPDLAARWRERGRKRFEHEFTAARWAGRLRAVYERARA